MVLGNVNLLLNHNILSKVYQTAYKGEGPSLRMLRNKSYLDLKCSEMEHLLDICSAVNIVNIEKNSGHENKFLFINLFINYST